MEDHLVRDCAHKEIAVARPVAKKQNPCPGNCFSTAAKRKDSPITHCTECGTAGSGKFCSDCGSALSNPVVANPVVNGLEILPTPDWEHNCRYELLMQSLEVRSTIDAFARRAPKGLTGEEFLKLCDKLVPCVVPPDLLAKVLQPLFASWGIQTGKSRVVTVATPIGRVMFRLLCSFAQHGQELRSVQQALDGCSFEATLPSDMWALEGDLLVAVRSAGNATEVQAATKIRGQMFDWGKSNRWLTRLFTELQFDPAPVKVHVLPKVA